MPVESLTGLLIAVAGSAALLALVYLALRKPVATVALLLVVWIATVAVRDAVDLSVVVADVRVTALDVISITLLGVGAVRFLSRGVPSFAHALVLVLVLLLVGHIARGVAVSDPQTALNSARGWVYFTAALVYAAAVPNWGRSAWRVLLIGGVLVAGAAIALIAIEGVPSADEFVMRDGELISARPIVASGGLLVLQAALLALLSWRSQRAGLLVVGLVLLAVVAVLQHRTVWVAAMLAAVVGFALWARERRQGREMETFAVVGVVLLIAPVAVWGLTQAGPLVESAKQVTATDSTFGWRTTGWDQLVSANSSTAELVLGGPAGEDLTRFINGTEVTVSAHNGFVDAFLRFGLPGVLVLILLGVSIWRGRDQIAERLAIPSMAVALLLVTQLAFSVGYSLDLLQGLIAGILASGVIRRSAEQPVAAADRASPLTVPSRYALR